MRTALASLMLSAAFLAGLSSSNQATAQSFSPEQTSEIETIIQDYLMENPQVIMDAVQALRQRQEEAAQAAAQAALENNQSALTNDPNSPVGGNPDGDVTMVEFFDYRCGYCKRAHPTVTSFVESDGNIRFIYKEWPILGPDSVYAARAALASREQDKYHEFHELLMTERDINADTVKKHAEAIGLDWEQLEADMESPFVTAHIEDTMQLAQSLGINGTPAFVIDDQLVPGAVDAATLEAIVRDIREKS